MSGCKDCWETPCKCGTEYAHCDERDCNDIIRCAQTRLTQVKCKEASVKHGEELIEVDGYEIFISRLYVNGTIVKAEQSLGKFMMHPSGAEKITTQSTLWWIEKVDQDELKFHRGAGPSDAAQVRTDVLTHKNQISVSAQVERGRSVGIESVYTRFVPIKVYLPKDMF